jgi:hypothetical protein
MLGRAPHSSRKVSQELFQIPGFDISGNRRFEGDPSGSGSGSAPHSSGKVSQELFQIPGLEISGNRRLLEDPSGWGSAPGIGSTSDSGAVSSSASGSSSSGEGGSSGSSAGSGASGYGSGAETDAFDTCEGARAKLSSLGRCVPSRTHIFVLLFA